MTAPDLWPHQQQTITFAGHTPIIFDTSDPGTGKTRSHIEIFVQRRAVGLTQKALVLCPKSLMVPAWQADFKKFAPELKTVIASAENREEAFNTEADVYISNIEAVNWLAKKTRIWRIKTFSPYATLIIDEITAFKNYNSQRSRNAKKIADDFTYKTGMTGTPTPNSITELWHQVLLLDKGERLGTSFTAFRNSTQVPIMKGGFTKWQDKENINAVISTLIDDITVRHKFDDVMSIPDNYTRHMMVQLPQKLQDIYEQLQEDAYLELTKGEVSAVNAAVLANKLLQVCSGAVYGQGAVPHVLDTARYELITDLIAERDHSVVFFSWSHQRDQLSAMCKKRGITYELIDGTVPNKKRSAIVDAFQAGNLQTVLMHPRTGAHGLTLTKGRTTIWASPRYEADLMKQGIHRVYRGGQTHKTENILISADNTIEPSVYDRLFEKTGRMADLLTLLHQARGCNDDTTYPTKTVDPSCDHRPNL